MSEQHGNQQTTTGNVGPERCVCNEILGHLRDCFGVSPEVRKHLSNSRIEFLKAIREVINQRIDRLSNTGQQGTKITVE